MGLCEAARIEAAGGVGEFADGEEDLADMRFGLAA